MCLLFSPLSYTLKMVENATTIQLPSPVRYVESSQHEYINIILSGNFIKKGIPPLAIPAYLTPSSPILYHTQFPCQFKHFPLLPPFMALHKNKRYPIAVYKLYNCLSCRRPPSQENALKLKNALRLYVIRSPPTYTNALSPYVVLFLVTKLSKSAIPYPCKYINFRL